MPSPAHQIPQIPFARRKGSAFGVEVLALEELRQRSQKLDHSIFKAHRIEFHNLLVITRGCGQHMVDFVLYPVEPGHLVWVAPGQVQFYDRNDDLQGFLILFQSEVYESKIPLASWPTSLRPPPGDFELLQTLTELIFNLRNQQLSTPPDRLAWRMLATVLELWEGCALRHVSEEGHTLSEEFEALDALLNQHFARHRDVSWYARKMGYSEKTLSRWCRRAVGVNAKTYLDRRVVLEAKRLLVHTEQSIDWIADHLGFSESTNFVKFFKRLDGRTPAAFRRLYV